MADGMKCRTPDRLQVMSSGTVLDEIWVIIRRLMIALIGMSLLLIGGALLFLPGPAFLVIPAGLGILALEFRWARRLLKRIRFKLEHVEQEIP
jgi:tellurite resistance protein TerC